MRVAKKSGLPPSTPNQGLHISSGGTGHQHFSLPQLQVEKAKFLVGVLQKPVLRFISPAGPEEFTLQALGPEQRVRVFNTRTGMIKRVCGFAGAGQFKDQDKGDKLQLLVLWVPTCWDLRDPDFARSKLSYRGRSSRRLCKILAFPLQAYHGAETQQGRLRGLGPQPLTPAHSWATGSKEETRWGLPPKLKNCSAEMRSMRKEGSLKCSQKNWIYLKQNVRKFTPKGTLENNSPSLLRTIS